MKIDLDPRLEELTERIIGCAFAVSTALGHGFLEAVYQKAMVRELAHAGLKCQNEVPFKIHYRGEPIGTYLADLVVENTVILELKAVEALAPSHRGQLLNYLKASRLPVGLLLNFGTPRMEVKRVLP